MQDISQGVVYTSQSGSMDGLYSIFNFHTLLLAKIYVKKSSYRKLDLRNGNFFLHVKKECNKIPVFYSKQRNSNEQNFTNYKKYLSMNFSEFV